MVRDFAKFALNLYSKPSSTTAQMEYLLKMIRKPAVNPELFQRIWQGHVLSLKGAYEMKP